MNPLVAAVQGLGFGAAQVALQGLLVFVMQEVLIYEAQGGGIRRKSRRLAPDWLPHIPVEEEEALLLVGIL